MPSDLTLLSDECLFMRQESINQKIDQRYAQLIAALPATSPAQAKNEYDGLTQTHMISLQHGWTAFANDFCTAQAKTYGLTLRYENRVITICQIQVGERHLKDLKTF